MSCKTALTTLREAIDAKLPEDQRCKKTIAQMTAAVQGLEVGGGGSSAAFYLATDIQGGLEKITVTGGYFYDDIGEPASLAGEYTLADKGCFGVDRVWYCPATTAQTVDGTEYASILGACIGCADFEWGYDDNDNIVYKKMWCISYGKTPDAYTNYFQDSDSGEKPSPFGITWETGGAAWGVTTPPVLTADVEDAEPYGPSSWAGKQMTWQERTIYVSYGAGVEDANGVWYRNDEGTPMSLNTVFFNFNGRSRILIVANGSTWRWVFRIDGYGDQWVYYNNFDFAENNIPNPFNPEETTWTHGSSDYKPVPTSTFGEEGYYPSDSETTGLPIARHAPRIGRIYNDDATVRIGAMYPAK